MLSKDFFRCFVSDFFNFNATFATDHQKRHLGGSIHDNCQIQLASDFATLLYEDLIYFGTGCGCLDGNQMIAEQIPSDRRGFRSALDQLDSTLRGDFRNGPLPSPASMHLGLYHCNATTEFFKCSVGFFWRFGNKSSQNGHLGFAEEFFCLRFVNFHQ